MRTVLKQFLSLLVIVFTLVFSYHLYAQEGETMSEKHTLTKLQKYVIYENGTEPAFENEYWDNKEPGIYVDRISGVPLFSSIDKYKSGTGWPSFTKPITQSVVKEVEDRKFFMVRTEVRSAQSDAHLGHVFTDGPQDKGGLRYCMNSAAMKFIHKDDLAKEGYGNYLYLFENK